VFVISANPFSDFLSSQKCDLFEVKKTKFKVISYPSELVSYIFNIIKRDLREVKKDVSRGRLSIFILCLLLTQKYDLVEVGIAMIRVVPIHSKYISVSLAYKNETVVFEKAINQGVA
jgi:hypothetical protein